jgi:hypothetical protein
LNEPGQAAFRRIDADRYRSYLVRLWREAPDGPWRCQASCLGTRVERRFAGLAELFEFLLADAAAGSGDAGGKAKTDPGA